MLRLADGGFCGANLFAVLMAVKQGMIDAVTILFLIFFLVMLLYGGISSTQYALQYGETSYSSWSPYMAPIKIIMVFAVFWIGRALGGGGMATMRLDPLGKGKGQQLLEMEIEVPLAVADTLQPAAA